MRHLLLRIILYYKLKYWKIVPLQSNRICIVQRVIMLVNPTRYIYMNKQDFLIDVCIKAIFKIPLEHSLTLILLYFDNLIRPMLTYMKIHHQ